MLIDERLYLQKKWIEDRSRCLNAKIPHEEIQFRTRFRCKKSVFVAKSAKTFTIRKFEYSH